MRLTYWNPVIGIDREVLAHFLIIDGLEDGQSMPHAINSHFFEILVQ
jgi:hypothetical protein